MSKKWRLTERTRTLLTLELAMGFPGAALMAFSIYNLKHIQRDKSIEAAIQRDFGYVLKIAEKKSWREANDLLTPVRKEFPSPDDGSQIKTKVESLLRQHPEYAYAVLYDKKNNLMVSRVQPGRDQDQALCAYTQGEINNLASWLPLDASSTVKHLRMMKEEHPVGFYGGGGVRAKQPGDFYGASFFPPRFPADGLAQWGVAFVERYSGRSWCP